MAVAGGAAGSHDCVVENTVENTVHIEAWRGLREAHTSAPHLRPTSRRSAHIFTAELGRPEYGEGFTARLSRQY